MRLPAILAFFFLFSCNDNKENPDAQKQPVNRPDSIISTNTGTGVNTFSPVDISPMDMSYYPVDYPISKMGKAATSGPLARVIYSRPHLQGRHVFDEVLKYGEPWRLGANESTELELFADARIGDKEIKAGRYVMYCIPQATEWKIILNSNIHSWGLKPDPSKDLASFTLPVVTTSGSLEYFTMVFLPAGNGAVLLMAWDNVEVRLPISF